MKRISATGFCHVFPAGIISAALCVAFATPASAQFKSIASFNSTNGADPEYGPLVQGRDGNYYGTTAGGGANGFGEIFKVNAGGTVNPIYSFCSQSHCADGENPAAGLVLGTDGNFYGTTLYGGDVSDCGIPYGCGTIFKATPQGVLTTLYTFTKSSPGAGPVAGLVEGTDGSFYGTTGSEGGDGTIFKITLKGALTPLHTFREVDGMLPYGGLTLGTDGNFYGTTSEGGMSPACNDGCGTVFKMTPAGKLTTLHSFNLTDGANPIGGVVQASNGNFYGTTSAGGTNEAVGCGQGANTGCGTVFEITSQEIFSTLYNFCSQTSCADGMSPYGTLVQGADGNFYGTTYLGGANSVCEFACGTVFELSSASALNTLHSFDSVDGSYPWAGLLLSTQGDLYGPTYDGGTSGNCLYGCGTIFSESVELSPFVKLVTFSGKVGSTIEILGQNFTSSTTVSFNGTPATSLSVRSGTYLSAVVPSGATTGYVTVTTASVSLQSNKVFLVIP